MGASPAIRSVGVMWAALIVVSFAGRAENGRAAEASAPGALAETRAGFRFQNELYGAEFDRAGRLLSFTIMGVECIEGDQSTAWWSQARVLQRVDERVLEGEAEQRWMRVQFEADQVTVQLRKTGPAHWVETTLTDHFRLGVFPRTGGTARPLPPDRPYNPRGGARFISDHGFALETHHRTDMRPENGGRFRSPVIYSDQVQTMTYRVLPEPCVLDRVMVDTGAYPDDHLFSSGTLSLPTRLGNEGDRTVRLDVRHEIRTYRPNQSGVVLASHEQAVEVPAGESRLVEASFQQKLEPGPYTFRVVLQAAERNEASLSGTLILDGANWHLPDLEPEDFDVFWQRTLEQTRSWPLEPEFRPGPSGYREVSFNGLHGRRVRGFLALPKDVAAGEKVPAVLSLPGAGYSAYPLIHEPMQQGVAHLALSTHDLPFNPGTRSHVTEGRPRQTYAHVGLEDRETYYYRHAYAGAARAVDFLRSLPEVDPDRIMVQGGSQGGSLALAVAGLVPDIQLVFNWVAGRSRWDLLTFEYTANGTYPPPEGVTKQQMFENCLAYDDVSYFARRIEAPIYFLVALNDNVNPGPLQWFAYREVTRSLQKEILVYPFAGHDSIGPNDPDGLLRRMKEQYLGCSW